MSNSPDKGTVLHILDFKPRVNRPLDHFLIKIAAATEEFGYATHFIFSQEPDDWFLERLPDAASYSQYGGSPYDAFDRVVDEARRVNPIFTTISFLPPFCRKTYTLGKVAPVIWIDRVSNEFTGYRGLRKIWAWLRGKFASKKLYKVISISDFNRNRNVSSFYLDPQKNVRIHNGCVLPDEADLHPIKGGVEYFFFCGMLRKVKGVHTLIKAFDTYCDSTSDNTRELWLAGQDYEDPTVHAALKQAKHADRIKQLGHRSDVHSLMAGAVAVVVPSEWPEAFGFVSVEGMFSGRPVIYSDAGALPEVVGEFGLCFEKGNVQQLAACLAKTASPTDDLLEMTASAKKRVQDYYNVGRMVKEYMIIFKDALDDLGAK